MVTSSRGLKLVMVLALLCAATGCATTLKPIYPTASVKPGAARTPGVRFSAEEVTFHEPGIPISTGNIWRRDVAEFTADRLNELTEAQPGAPVVRTRVTFEMYGPTMFQVGSWKEMTIRLTSQLPDGRVVQSEPRSAFIDNNLEYIAQQVLLFSGPVVEVGAFVFGIFLFSQGLAYLSNPVFCGCLLALAFGGLALNLAQASLQYVVSVLEERRSSDLFLEAIKAHAEDVQRAVTTGVLPPRTDPLVPRDDDDGSPTPLSPKKPTEPPPLSPAPAVPPPPMLGDPADVVVDPADDPPPPEEAPDEVQDPPRDADDEGSEEATPVAPPPPAGDGESAGPPTPPRDAFLF